MSATARHRSPDGDAALDGLSVVIVSYNDGAALARTIGRLASWSVIDEVVVVDHGSDGAGAMAQGSGTRVLIDPLNPGFGAGQNHGIEGVSSGAVLLLNPDAIVEESAVLRGLQMMRNDRLLVGVQGWILNPDGGADRSGGRELNAWDLLGRALGARALLDFEPVRRLLMRTNVLSEHLNRCPPSDREVDTLAATALLVRTSAFREVGGFDQRYFLYGEDLDLCRRLRGAGGTLVQIAMPWAHHRNGSSSSNWAMRELVWWEGTLQFARQWWPVRDRLLALVAAGIMWSRLRFSRDTTRRSQATSFAKRVFRGRGLARLR